MILSAQTIRRIKPVDPFVERGVIRGRSYGLSVAGYDIRIAQDMILFGGDFKLASSVERFDMPDDVLAEVKDKSSWAREGLSVFNTVIEPGWRGYLTLELKNQGKKHIVLQAGDPIAQVLFYRLDEPAEAPYSGKYQDQENMPVPARLET